VQAVLALLSAQTTILAGVGYLVIYNLVFVAPLVAMLALASSPPIYRKLARWQLHQRALLKVGTGVVTIGVGLLTLLVV
jgi:cytochrome c-type biogenesis protein